MKTTLHLLCVTVIVTLAGCQNGPQLKSTIGGKAGEVVVVYDKQLWDTTFTKTVKELLAPAYPALPQFERKFDIISIPENAFSNLFQVHRNVVFIQIMSDSIPAEIIVKHDIWAQPQTVVRINGNNAENIVALIQQHEERLAHILEHAERDRQINNAKKYEDRALRDTVNKAIGGSPYIPQGYILRKKNEKFIWIGYETKKAQLGIFIYKYPYKDSTSFRNENIIAQRNAILKEEVPGPYDNTYMTTASFIAPESRHLLFNKIHFIETRGLWEVENDFMGGPFISHVFLDKTGQNVLVLEAYVYNPSGEKRNYLRQVEAIIYSFEWKENQ